MKTKTCYETHTNCNGSVCNHASHTPGPWRYHLGRGAEPRFHIQDKGGYQIASTTALNGHRMAKEENEARQANARLLSAAPELLEACQAVLRGLELSPLPGTETDVAILRQAIAKAI